MTTVLTPPKANIPIGSVTIGGRPVNVTISPEWLRYLSQGLYERSGGYTSTGTLDEISNTVSALEQMSDLSVLIAEIDALRKRVEALEDGVHI